MFVKFSLVSMEGKMFEIFLLCMRELHIQRFTASKQFQSFVGRAWDGEGSWVVGRLNGRIKLLVSFSLLSCSVWIPAVTRTSSYFTSPQMMRIDESDSGCQILREHDVPYWIGIFQYRSDDCYVEAQSFWADHCNMSSRFKVNEMITPSSLNDDTRSLLTPLIVRIRGGFLIRFLSLKKNIFVCLIRTSRQVVLWCSPAC